MEYRDRKINISQSRADLFKERTGETIDTAFIDEAIYDKFRINPAKSPDELDNIPDIVIEDLVLNRIKECLYLMDKDTDGMSRLDRLWKKRIDQEARHG